jgi:hypothetical protein
LQSANTIAAAALHDKAQTASNELRFVARLSERAWVARVGGERTELVEGSRQADERAAQAQRSQAGRRLPMGVRQLWGRNGEAALAQNVANLKANLRVAGPQGIDALLASEDVLQRHVLLTGLISLLQPDDPHRGLLEQRVQDIERDEGQALRALINASEAFTPQSADADAQSDAAALRRAYAAFAAEPSAGERSPIAPVQIVQRLLSEVGPADFESALVRLQRGAALDLQAPQSSRAAPLVHMALAEAGAFRQVSSVLRGFQDLRTSLPADAGKRLSAAGSAVDAVLKNVEGSADDARAWCAAVTSPAGVEGFQEDFLAMRALRRFVADLPNSLWRQPAQRASVLSGLDQAMPNLQQTGLEDRKKSQLRAELPNQAAAAA